MKLGFGEILSESFEFFFTRLRLFFQLVTLPWILSLLLRIAGAALTEESLPIVLAEKALDVIPTVMFMVLHQGKIAEMKTGEGKTLVATLPVYLNALESKGVHVVTVNDYLAKRDAEWMGRIHRFLGLTVGVVVPQMDPAEKQQSYRSDITYGTNNEFGFDYLRDNMAVGGKGDFGHVCAST